MGEDNEYSEHLEGTLVESGAGKESVVNKLRRVRSGKDGGFEINLRIESS